jgi:hypothetical protein
MGLAFPLGTKYVIRPTNNDDGVNRYLGRIISLDYTKKEFRFRVLGKTKTFTMPMPIDGCRNDREFWHAVSRTMMSSECIQLFIDQRNGEIGLIGHEFY